MVAAAQGDLQSLVDVLAPDLVLLTDGGGVKRAALRPMEGADKIMRFLLAVYEEASSFEFIMVNGAPALRLELDGETEAVATFTVEAGLVTHIYIVRNPHKLQGLTHAVALTR